MIDCKTSIELIDEYLDGMISETALDNLKTHTETCDACRIAFERAELMREAIGEALASQTAGDAAAEAISKKLASVEPAATTIKLWPTIRKAVAAVILLAAGVLIGMTITGGEDIPETALLAISTADIEGTVLIQNAGSDIWRVLDADSAVYLGDTLRSTTGARFALQLEGQSRIQVDQNSMLIVKEYDYDGQTRFRLEHGQCTAVLESPHGPFFIETPHTQAEAMGTEFTVTVE